MHLGTTDDCVLIGRFVEQVQNQSTGNANNCFKRNNVTTAQRSYYLNSSTQIRRTVRLSGLGAEGSQHVERLCRILCVPAWIARWLLGAVFCALLKQMTMNGAAQGRVGAVIRGQALS